MDILQETLSALESENSVILATIISTTGSTPASAFSKMLVKENGRTWVGTVGGGCLEGDVLEAAQQLYGLNKAEVLTFHLNEDDMMNGLICGGSLDVLIEPITRDSLPMLQEMKSLRDEGEDAVVATFLESSGGISLKKVLPCSGELDLLKGRWQEVLRQSKHLIVERSTDDLAGEIRKAHQRNETRRVKMPDGELILEPMTGQPDAIIFGGGHVSKSISRAAAMVGFRVTVVDDRKEYANPQRFPEVSRTLAVEFSDAFNRLTVKPSTFIVIVTRGHRSDEEILERALNTPARYIGMIGSKRKVLTTYEHLVERGVQVKQLERIHSPMGIELGAVTAEEIGISVVAQLIQVRRGGSVPLQHKSEGMKNLLESLKPRQARSSR